MKSKVAKRIKKFVDKIDATDEDRRKIYQSMKKKYTSMPRNKKTGNLNI